MKESRLWFWHLISGLALIFLLGIHTVVQHFDSILTLLGVIPQQAWRSGGELVGSLNFQYAVLPRMKSVSMTAIYLLLLCFGLYHGLYGVRSLLYELKFSAKAKRAIGAIVLVVGLAAAAYGIYTILLGHMIAPTLSRIATTAAQGGK